MDIKKESGFTLIELLIVVAIIAILAAIAIPNFLAAQTRSKVSRVKANMRTSATGLESYFVDNNSYPGDYIPTDGWSYNTLALPIFVTTPISYITKVPDDIFDVFGGIGAGFHKIRYRIAGWGYQSSNAGPTGNPEMGAGVSDFLGVNTGSGPDQIFTTREANGTNVQYVLFSFGPGQQLANNIYGTGFWPGGSNNTSEPIPQPSRYWYDPTNGTISLGYIVRESSGVGSP